MLCLSESHMICSLLTCTVVPDSVVVGCLGNSSANVKPGEIALRLHFEAEHSNVLIVTAELLNGCLTTCEVVAMDMSLHPCDAVTVSSESNPYWRMMHVVVTEAVHACTCMWQSCYLHVAVMLSACTCMHTCGKICMFEANKNSNNASALSQIHISWCQFVTAPFRASHFSA